MIQKIRLSKFGIARTWKAVQEADIALLLLDGRSGLAAEDAAIVARLPERLPLLTLHNKADLLGVYPANRERELWVSAKTGLGMSALKHTLLALAGWQQTGEVRLRGDYRPLVEPGGGRPGHGPRPSHRPAAAGDRLSAGQQGQHRRAHRRPASREAGAGRQHPGQRIYRRCFVPVTY